MLLDLILVRLSLIFKGWWMIRIRRLFKSLINSLRSWRIWTSLRLKKLLLVISTLQPTLLRVKRVSTTYKSTKWKELASWVKLRIFQTVSYPKWPSNITRWRSWESWLFLALVPVVLTKRLSTFFVEHSFPPMVTKKLSPWWTCKTLVSSRLKTRNLQDISIGTGRRLRPSSTCFQEEKKELTCRIQVISLMCIMDLHHCLSVSLRWFLKKESLHLVNLVEVFSSNLVLQMTNWKFQILNRSYSIQQPQEQEVLKRRR